MERFMVTGGNKLEGKVEIQSAKNSVLPMIAAAIMTCDQVIIKNCPKIVDVDNMLKILSSLGVYTKYENGDLLVCADCVESYEVPIELCKELRSSVFMLGALLTRNKRAKLYFPGGCNIGSRPIDIHIDALKRLGVNVIEGSDGLYCSVKNNEGEKISLSYPSVGATENIMLASVLRKGKTEIRNAAKEPEIVDLMRFLNSMGAKIYGAGTDTILIDGVDKLHGTEYKPISDRIEAGTFMISAVITGGELEIFNCDIKNISTLVNKLRDNACKITLNNDIIHIKSGRVKKSFDIDTAPYPGFPTDLQPQALVLNCLSEGTAFVRENVFETRFGYVSELIKMGANVEISGNVAKVVGVDNLHATDVYAADLRGGAALVLAALATDGTSNVYGINHILRGYCDFDQKLRNLGANIIKKG